jgi:hypothetical protein
LLSKRSEFAVDPRVRARSRELRQGRLVDLADAIRFRVAAEELQGGTPEPLRVRDRVVVPRADADEQAEAHR